MAIGLLDSGVGGLSVMKEVKKMIPGQDLYYFADSLYCPYGSKTPEQIRARVFSISRFLREQGAGILVLACNTSSIASLDDLRRISDVPVVGMEPAVKLAAAVTRNGRIGVLATGVTLAGERYNSLKERFARAIEVISSPCPGLVELVETGEIDCPRVEDLLIHFLQPLLAGNVDTVVLGCTHYHFLRPVVEKLTGGKVNVIDTSQAVAAQTSRILSQLQPAGREEGRCYFFTSGDPRTAGQTIRRLWGDEGIVVEKSLV